MLMPLKLQHLIVPERNQFLKNIEFPSLSHNSPPGWKKWNYPQNTSVFYFPKEKKNGNLDEIRKDSKAHSEMEKLNCTLLKPSLN